jgi:hypothetical protein
LERQSVRPPLWISATLLGFLISLAIATVVVVHGRTAPIVPENIYVSSFEAPNGGLERQLALADGQAFAAAARDPALRRPEVFLRGAGEAAYRFQRPLYSYMAWLVSVGRPGWVPSALLGINVLAGAAVTGLCALLLSRRGVAWWYCTSVLFLPGSLLAMYRSGSELVALAWVLLGVLSWTRRPGEGTIWFLLAALTRETMLIVPAALGLEAALRQRDVAPLRPFMVSSAGWALWVLVVRQRFGAWPGGHYVGGAVAPPLVGLFRAVRRWQPSPVPHVLHIAAVIVLAALCVHRRRDNLSVIVMGYFVLTLVLGVSVWAAWQDVSRVLLPLHLFGGVVVAGWLQEVVSSRYRRRAVPATGSGPERV